MGMRERFRRHEDKICRVINAGLLLCAALQGVWRLSGMGDAERIYIAAAFAALAALAATSLLPVRGRVILLLAGAVCIGAACGAAGWERTADFLRGGLDWLTGKAGALPETWISGYELLLAVCLAALCWLTECVLDRFPVARGAAAVLLAAGLAACLFLRADPGHGCVVCAIGYIAVACAEWTQRRWKKTQRDGGRTYLLRIMPFLLLYVVFMALMPVSEDPYEWQWAKDIYARMWETVLAYVQNIRWGEREGFDEGLAGFSDSGTLAGSVGENPREVMLVELRSGMLTNVYLTGKAYDSFDGRQWRQEYSGELADPFWDAQETLQAVNDYNGAYRQDYLGENVLRIRYRDFHTGYLFAPLKITAVQSGGEEPEYALRGGSLCWDTSRGYGTEYEVRYYRMNTGQEVFDRFLEAAQRENAASRQSRCQDEICEYYLGEIALPDGVRAYLDEITEDAETDIRKLRAIERELSSCTYTRTPGPLPEEVADAGSFLEYFLLESRSGYCSHFATAFVLLARAEGIPARYVQGFCVPVRERGEVSVYSDMAHAWPEVYIAGAGWIPFEPTPGYASLRHTSWKTVQKGEGEILPEQDFGRQDAEQEGLWQQEPEPEDAETPEGIERAAAGYLGIWLRFAVPAALLLGACALLVEAAWYRRQYRRMSPEEKFRRKAWENLQILAWLGIRRGAGETLQELRKRAEHTAGTLHFLESYERILYGGAQVSEEMLEETKEEGRMLLGRLRKQSGRIYVFYRLRWYLICHSRSGGYDWRKNRRK